MSYRKFDGTHRLYGLYAINKYIIIIIFIMLKVFLNILGNAMANVSFVYRHIHILWCNRLLHNIKAHVHSWL